MKFIKNLFRRKVKKQIVDIPEEIVRAYLLKGGKGWNVRLS